MGKHKYFKFMGFLNISDEAQAEIHTIPKTWEKWILIIQEKYGKNANISKCWVSQIFWVKQKSIQFPKYGTNSHSKGKIWENTNISKSSVSGIFSLKQKSRQFPKYGKCGLPWYRKSMGKQKHFKFMCFLNISDEAEIHTTPHGKSEFP